MDIRDAVNTAEIENARKLFQEYAIWLDVDLCFQNFAQELAELPGVYAPPRGRLLIAFNGTDAVGCVALRPAEGECCEMKRLFVRPHFRGQGVGRSLAERVIAEARTIGYSSMMLDTLPRMGAAIALYEALGFARRSAYYPTPLAQTIFMELQL